MNPYEWAKKYLNRWPDGDSYDAFRYCLPPEDETTVSDRGRQVFEETQQRIRAAMAESATDRVKDILNRSQPGKSGSATEAYAEQLKADADRQGRRRTIMMGGVRVGRQKVQQDAVDEARAKGQSVWVRRKIDGRSLVEKRAGVWLDDGPMTATEAVMQAKEGYGRSLTIHVPRAELVSWQRWRWRLWRRITQLEIVREWGRPETPPWMEDALASFEASEVEDHTADRKEILVFVKEICYEEGFNGGQGNAAPQ
jgi:hypothetical protein